MNAKTAKKRQILKARATANRAAARIRRNGQASLTTHALATGLAPKEARTVASSLRKAAARLDITGTQHRVHAGRHMRNCTRYTPVQVAALATVYRPRKMAYKLAADTLRLAA
ncbi:hypothetical protein AB0D12_31530 [Streptomyces sp. NPDC048479]|uniref:hypothetical protein n=1 Tax=Streptomyces sp. NPDC048479 TaxID=3154725 RepID=UPI003439C990